MGCLLVSGAAILIVYNYQNETIYIDKDGKLVEWNHPFFQASLVSLGMSLSMIIYAVKGLIEKKNNNRTKSLSSTPVEI